MSKHTPGPWVAIFSNDSRSDGYIREAAKDEGGRQVAVARVTSSGRDLVEQWANRRLIAAAPKLLAALKLAKDHAELEDEVLDIVDAAIAEAEGRA